MIITKQEFDKAKKAGLGEVFDLKVDCGLGQVKALRKEESLMIEGDLEVSFQEKLKDNFLYLLDEQGLRKIDFFSQNTNRYYKLQPTPDWPTIAISSVPMHRRSSPRQDTLNKIAALRPFGYVLDTCTGPGYTAIEASKKAEKILTFEKDPLIHQIAKINPYSRDLFGNPRIEWRLDDVSRGVLELADSEFDCIMHDPPTFTMAPELFSQAFYFQLRRVLKKDGRLLHYAPYYKIKQGVDFPGSIAKNLAAAGFREARFVKEAQGVICLK